MTLRRFLIYGVLSSGVGLLGMVFLSYENLILCGICVLIALALFGVFLREMSRND